MSPLEISTMRRGSARCAALACAALLALFAAGPRAGAQGFERASSQADARLDQALRELAAVRDRIADEKIPLSRSVSSLEDQVLALRQEQSRLLEVRDSRTIDLTSLRRQVEAMAEQEEFIESRLDEFVRDFEGRLDISELPRYQERTAAAKLADKRAGLDAGQERDAQVAVVKAALERIGAQLGGEVFPGEALSPEGVLTAGTFVSLGPTVYYASADGTVAGVVENQLNAADPVVVSLPGDLEEGVIEVARGGAGPLPLDATLGKALKVEKARKSVATYVQEGGVVGYVIIGLGAAALLLTAWKAREILGFPVADPEDVDGVLNELAKGNREAAAWQAERVEGAAGAMLQTGVENVDEKRGVLEELLFEQILKVRPGLERYLPFLAITAAAAPLLGLLGTVIGMIKTFQLITIFGTGDARSLSSGISEALITTALGLIVAIPTLILHGALSRMAKRKLGELEQLSVAFVNGVAGFRSSGSSGDSGSSGQK